MWRKAAAFVLALAIGFFVYRAALLAMPSVLDASAPVVLGSCDTFYPPHFDAVTGMPVPWSCTNRDGQGAALLYAGEEMYEHWSRSVSIGLAGAGLALILLWWFGRRRPVALQRRSEAPTSA